MDDLTVDVDPAGGDVIPLVEHAKDLAALIVDTQLTFITLSNPYPRDIELNINIVKNIIGINNMIIH